MELMRLLEGIEIERIVGETEQEIAGIAYHSRRVEKGFLFAAIRGLEFDGHRFIGDALERGATAILLEEEKTVPKATMIRVPNSRRALARISSNFFGSPSSRVKLIGVTGTNGKTTTTFLLESILKRAGNRVGVIGTINYRYAEKIMPAPNTTPESLDLQKILGEMVHEGITHVISIGSTVASLTEVCSPTSHPTISIITRRWNTTLRARGNSSPITCLPVPRPRGLPSRTPTIRKGRRWLQGSGSRSSVMD
jgi:UDP-N-acetylmuramoyl-L-alanyl-D-glutamate--2,6-diaminopimelate ligase